MWLCGCRRSVNVGRRRPVPASKALTPPLARAQGAGGRTAAGGRSLAVPGVAGRAWTLRGSAAESRAGHGLSRQRPRPRARPSSDTVNLAAPSCLSRGRSKEPTPWEEPSGWKEEARPRPVRSGWGRARQGRSARGRGTRERVRWKRGDRGRRGPDAGPCHARGPVRIRTRLQQPGAVTGDSTGSLALPPAHRLRRSGHGRGRPSPSLAADARRRRRPGPQSRSAACPPCDLQECHWPPTRSCPRPRNGTPRAAPGAASVPEIVSSAHSCHLHPIPPGRTTCRHVRLAERPCRRRRGWGWRQGPAGAPSRPPARHCCAAEGDRPAPTRRRLHPGLLSVPQA